MPLQWQSGPHADGMALAPGSHGCVWCCGREAKAILQRSSKEEPATAAAESTDQEGDGPSLPEASRAQGLRASDPDESTAQSSDEVRTEGPSKLVSTLLAQSTDTTDSDPDFFARLKQKQQKDSDEEAPVAQPDPAPPAPAPAPAPPEPEPEPPAQGPSNAGTKPLVDGGAPPGLDEAFDASVVPSTASPTSPPGAPQRCVWGGGGLLLTTRHHWGGGGGHHSHHHPLLKDCTKCSSGPSANQKFSLAPSAPLITQQHWDGVSGGGGGWITASKGARGSANAETTAARAPAAAADRTQRPDATCEGTNG